MGKYGETHVYCKTKFDLNLYEPNTTKLLYIIQKKRSKSVEPQSNEEGSEESSILSNNEKEE